MNQYTFLLIGIDASRIVKKIYFKVRTKLPYIGTGMGPVSLSEKQSEFPKTGQKILLHAPPLP
jgi:hypothetical protein